jgi:hypothetical protein
MSSDGNLPLRDDSGKQPFKRRLYPENCRKANSHSSALCGALHKADYVDRTIMWN